VPGPDGVPGPLPSGSFAAYPAAGVPPSGFYPAFPAAGAPHAGFHAAIPDAVALLKALRRRWGLAFGLGLLLAAGAAAAAWYAMPSAKYLGYVRVHVAAKPPEVVFPSAESLADFSLFQRAQVAMVKSRPVLEAALAEPRVADLDLWRDKADPVEWLEKNLQADYTLAPEILRISLKGDEPEDLKIVLDAVTGAYLREFHQQESTRQRTRLRQLQDLYTQFDDSLREKRQKLTNLAKKTGPNDAQVKAVHHEFALQRLAEAQKELMRNQLEVTRLEGELAAHKAKQKLPAEQPIPEGVLDEVMAKKDPTIAFYLRLIGKLQEELDSTERVAQGGQYSAHYRKIFTELDDTRKRLATARDRLRPEVIKDLRAQARADFADKINQLEDEIRLMKEYEKVLQNMVDSLAKDTRFISESTVDLESLRTEILPAEDLTKKIADRMQAVKMEILAPPRVSRMEEQPALSHGPENKRQLIVSGVAGLGTLALVLVVVSWWEFHAHRISQPQEVVHELGLKVVGVLPPLPRAPARRLLRPPGARLAERENSFRESVDTTCTLMLHTTHGGMPRVILVASALGGEGKTSLASHLAVGLAGEGCHTLLIDGDLRKPALHELFELPPRPGFCELLRGHADLAAVVHASPVHRLSVVPAGRFNRSVIHALAQKKARKLFERLKEDYDFILVDSSPVLLVADALLLGQCADAALISILHNVSRLPTVQAAHHRMAAVGIRLLGAVVNGARGDTYGFGYAYARPPESFM
jgi:capsular exopolysaccharide synthesis family protein